MNLDLPFRPWEFAIRQSDWLESKQKATMRPESRVANNARLEFHCIIYHKGQIDW